MSWMQDPDSYLDYDDTLDDLVGDQIMCLVDCHKPMVDHYFQDSPDCHIVSCLKLVLSVMKFQIVHGDNSSIGLLFFGTQYVNEKRDQECYKEYIKLGVPSAENINKVQDLIDNFHEKFDNEIGSQGSESKKSNLYHVLWKCTDEFQRCAPKGKRTDGRDRDIQTRIWIFTNEDSPDDGDLEQQRRVTKLSEQFYGQGIPISLWYIDRNYQLESFRVGKFYSKILLTGVDAEGDEYNESLRHRIVRASPTGFDEANRRVREHFYAKRALFQGLMDVGLGAPNALVGVQLFSQFKIAKKPTAMKIDAVTHQITVSESNLITASGKVVEQEEKKYVKEYVKMGDGQVPMSRTDVQRLVEEESRMGMGPQSFHFDPASVSAHVPAAAASSSTHVASKSAAAKQQRPTISLLDDDDDDDYDGGGGDEGGTASSNLGVLSSPSMMPAAPRLPPTAAASPPPPPPAEGGGGRSSDLFEAAGAYPFVSVKVLYYAAATMLPPELSLMEPLFMVPHDTTVRGSSAIFSALLEVMLQRDLLAVVKYCGPNRTRKSAARMAALLPQALQLDEYGDSVLAAGFNLIKLPFKGDIRANPVPVAPALRGIALEQQAAAPSTGGDNVVNPVRAAEGLIDAFMLSSRHPESCAAGGDSQDSSQYTETQTTEGGSQDRDQGEGQSLSKAQQQNSSEGEGETPTTTTTTTTTGLGSSYNYLDIEGPARQQFFSVLESVALSYKMHDQRVWTEGDDRMCPDLKAQDRPSQRRHVEAFKNAVELPDNALSLVGDSKRPSVYAGDTAGSASKRQKVVTEPMDAATVADLKASDLNDFTLPALKDYCRKLGLPVGGKKADVVERVQDKLNEMK